MPDRNFDAGQGRLWNATGWMNAAMSVRTVPGRRRKPLDGLKDEALTATGRAGDLRMQPPLRVGAAPDRRNGPPWVSKMFQSRDSGLDPGRGTCGKDGRGLGLGNPAC